MERAVSLMTDRWADLKLSQRFGLASFLVLLISAFIIGSWVTAKIRDGVVSNSASTTAVYVEAFVAPVALDLQDANRLSPESIAILDGLTDPINAERGIQSIKLWKPGGIVVYSSEEELIGKTFPVTSDLQKALYGTVAAEYSDHSDEADHHERPIGPPFLEIYSPVSRSKDSDMFTVAEFYVDATDLKAELSRVNFNSWAIVGTVTFIVYGLLFGIVLGGSRTIDRQQRSLENRVDELSDLQRQLRLASRRASELNERFLRRVGSDLHDGPAQLLGFARLKLDALQPDASLRNVERRDAFRAISLALEDALSEIRNLSAGLILPELVGLPAEAVVRKAVDGHARRTGMQIETDLGSLPSNLSRGVSICLYRLIQEALTNTFRHAGVSKAKVCAYANGDQMTVTVSDAGAGFDNASIDIDGSDHLGLAGLRERITSIGGAFDVESAIGRGTIITADLPLIEEQFLVSENSVRKSISSLSSHYRDLHPQFAEVTSGN